MRTINEEGTFNSFVRPCPIINLTCLLSALYLMLRLFWDNPATTTSGTSVLLRYPFGPHPLNSHDRGSNINRPSSAFSTPLCSLLARGLKPAGRRAVLHRVLSCDSASSWTEVGNVCFLNAVCNILPDPESRISLLGSHWYVFLRL